MSIAAHSIVPESASGAWHDVYERVRERRDDLDDGACQRHAARVASAIYSTGCTHEHATEKETALDDIPKEGRRLEKLMDREERGLANDLRQIAIDYKKDFKKAVRDSRGGAQAMTRQLERLRKTYLDRYREAIRARIAAIRDKTQDITLEENPRFEELVDKRNLPSPTQGIQHRDFSESLQMLVDDLARELLNRSEGAAVDSHRENERQRAEDGEPQRFEIDRPADSTIDGVAGEAGSSAVNEGRDDVAKEAQEASERSPDEPDMVLMAVRTSVLDVNTCDPCRDLDGKTVEVGSKAYSLYSPPSFCLGRERCRCYWEYEERTRKDNAAVVELVELREHASFSADEGTWHLLYSWGKKRHPKGDYEVDQEFAAKMVQSFEYMKRVHGDHPPIWRNHKDSGFTWGELVDMRVGEAGVEGKLAFNGLAKPYLEQGAIDRLSPTHIAEWTDPETGEVLENVVFEVSFVSREHLKSLPTVSESRKRQAPETPESFELIQQEAQMPEEQTEQTEERTEEQVENATDTGETAGEPFGDEPDAPEEEPVRNMPKMKPFHRVLDEMLPASDDAVFGASRSEALEQLASGTGMSADELGAMIDEGSLVYPTDALVEAVAELKGVEPSAIRSGEALGESGGDGDTGGDDQEPEAPMPQESDEEMENAAQLRDEIEQLRRENALYRCQSHDLDEDTTERLVSIYESAGEDTFEQALGAIEGVQQAAATPDTQPPTPEQSEATIGEEQGVTGGTAEGAASMRKLAHEAAERGLSGADLIRHFHENNRQLTQEARETVQEYRNELAQKGNQ